MSEYFCLRWSNYQSSLSSAFKSLQEEDNFCDVTISSEGNSMKAHKVILSACSSYFKQLLKNINQWQHPVLVFNHIPFQDLRSILNFVYQGQVNIVQDNLQSFLKTAEVFRIKGLTEESCVATDLSDKNGVERQDLPTSVKMFPPEELPTSVKIFPPEDKKGVLKRPKPSSANSTHQPPKDPLSGGADIKRQKLGDKPESLSNSEPEERGRHVRQEDVKQEPLEAGSRDEICSQYDDAGPLNNEHLSVSEDTSNILVKSGTDLETVNCVVCRATLSNSNALYYHMNYVHSSGVQPMDFMRKMAQSEDIVKQEGD